MLDSTTHRSAGSMLVVLDGSPGATDGADATDDAPRRTGAGRKYHHFRNISLERLSHAEASKLLKQYGRLVVMIVNEYLPRVASHPLIDPDDMIAIGQMLMLQACESYEPDRGTKLSTWICHQMRQGLGNVVRETHGTTRLEAMRFKEGRAVERDLARMPPLSLDAPMGGEDGEITLLSVIADARGAVDDEVSTNEKRRRFYDLLETLCNPREQRFMHMLLEGATLAEIGDQNGISRQRVEQVCKKAVEKIAKRLDQDERAAAHRQRYHRTMLTG